METIFKVISSNPSNSGKTFVWKLEVSSIAKVFGVAKTVKRTYYIGGMPSAVAIGTELKEDLSKFNITERATALVEINGQSEFMDIEKAEEKGLTYTKMMLSWLHVKVA